MDDLCRRFQESWGEPDMPEDLAHHGESCKPCLEFVRCQVALQETLPAWQTPEFSADFELTVMSRIAEEGTKPPTVWDWIREAFQVRLSIPIPVGAVAGVVLIASLLLNAYLWQDKGQENTLANIPKVAIGATPTAGTGMPTPQVVSLDNQAMTIPREWLGAGMFLLVPVPQQGFYYSDIHTTEENDRSGEI